MLFVTKPLSKDVTGAAEEARRVTTDALERAGELAADTSHKVRAGIARTRARRRTTSCAAMAASAGASSPTGRWTSALIAAAAGATVVAVTLALLRNRRDRQEKS